MTEEASMKINKIDEKEQTLSIFVSNYITKQEIKEDLSVLDQVRENNLSIIQNLQKLWIEKIVMLTGDNQATGQSIGTQLGLSQVKAELMR
ncbi:hypothetical protein [Domibacillus aminovorans]|uniref:Uncharacterized protein n=1 Tax=Domibacillus aminovorans TaxID=29332 RepID=A0A177LAF0_9BACI|nr:hypothetical protein AWH49_10480 [Domibacillus aminovorans]